MKQLQKIKAFYSGSILSSLFIMVLAVFALISFVISSAYVGDRLFNYLVIKNSKVKDGYIFAASVYEGIYQQGGEAILARFEQSYETIKNNEYVEKVYAVRNANVIEYKGGPLSILLYDKEFLDAFPMLRKWGIDFSKDPGGVIVSSDLFNDMNQGDSFDFEFFNGVDRTPGSLNVAGHMKYPYKYLSFSGGSTYLTSEDLLSNLPLLIMQPDEETFAMLEKNTRIIYSPDVMFTFKKGITDAQIEETIQELQKTGIVDSMSNIIERSREMIIDNVRAVISRPLFLMIASVIAYLNVLLIMVFKKQKDMSINYLCGARKRDIVTTVFCSCFIITVIPSLIAAVFILMAPELQWKGRFQGNGLLITTDHLWVVAGYFAVTVIASVVAILISLGRKSPLEYLRGLE